MKDFISNDIVFRITGSKLIAFTMLLVFFEIINIITRDFLFVDYFILLIASIWVFVGFPILMSWGIQLSDNAVIDGYQLTSKYFIVRRKLYYDDIGKIWKNGNGDVVLFHKESFVFPGKNEIVLSHHLKNFDSAVQNVLKKIDLSKVDESVIAFIKMI